MNAKFIKEMADEIREKLKGGTLFGEPIDMENVDELIVATKGITEMEEIKKRFSFPRRL